MIDPDDPATQVHGLKKRLLRRLPDPVSILEDWNGVDRNSFCEHFAPMGRAWVVRMQRIMKARLRRFVQLWAHHNVEPLTREPDFDEWLERGTWTRSQKDRMRKEWAEKYHSTLPPVNKSASVAPFVKAECYPTFKACRWINAANDAFKMASGPWFWQMEKHMYDVTGRGPKNAAGHSWFIKHTPVPERPALIAELRDYGTRFVSSDFTSFEASFTPEVMRAIELQVYDRYLLNFPEVRRYISRVLTGTRHGKTAVGVRFQRPGGRMSGDPCTSLGNGVSNMLLWKFWAQVVGRTICGYVEGDDGIFAVDASPEGVWADPGELFKFLGFDVKANWVRSPLDASFCGLLCTEDLQIIRDPRETVHKFAWSLTNPNANEKLCRKLLRAKALSLCYELPHCPILRPLADWALRETAGSVAVFDDAWVVKALRDTGDFEKMKKNDVPVFAPTEGTRSKFEELYGISVSQQKFLEAQVALGNLTLLEEVIDSREHSYCRWRCVQYN